MELKSVFVCLHLDQQLTELTSMQAGNSWHSYLHNEQFKKWWICDVCDLLSKMLTSAVWFILVKKCPKMIGKRNLKIEIETIFCYFKHESFFRWFFLLKFLFTAIIIGRTIGMFSFSNTLWQILFCFNTFFKLRFH